MDTSDRPDRAQQTGPVSQVCPDSSDGASPATDLMFFGPMQGNPWNQPGRPSRGTGCSTNVTRAASWLRRLRGAPGWSLFGGSGTQGHRLYRGGKAKKLMTHAQEPFCLASSACDGSRQLTHGTTPVGEDGPWGHGQVTRPECPDEWTRMVAPFRS